MDKIEIAKCLLNKVGMPKNQQSTICCLTLLALANIKNDSSFQNATNNWIRIHDVISFINTEYKSTYAENSRETIRKCAMHHFRTAALIEDNGEATNNPNYKYRLTEEFLSVLQSVSEPKEVGDSIVDDSVIRDFTESHQRLIDLYSSKKKMEKMPVKINNQDFTFSPGKHNQLQKAIIEEFAPRFAPNSECLYVGDTIKKDLVINEKKLNELGFEITIHDKMPDVVLYRDDKKWIYFIESVTSVGPMNSKRILEIKQMSGNVEADIIYVTAFLDFKSFKKFSEELAWETEVWIASMPEHMIHLNGDKFLGPRKE